MKKQDGKPEGITISDHETNIHISKEEIEELAKVVDEVNQVEDGVITLSTDEMTDEEILESMNQVAREVNNLKHVKKDEEKNDDVMEITEL